MKLEIYCPLSLVASVLAIALSECPDGWSLTSRLGTCLKSAGKTLSYSDAENYCRQLGATLAITKTKEMNDDFADFIRGPDSNVTYSTIWISLNDREKEGDLVWADGSLVAWSTWNTNGYLDPDNKDYPTRRPADCIGWRRQASNWMDQDCDRSHEVVCEKSQDEKCGRRACFDFLLVMNVTLMGPSLNVATADVSACGEACAEEAACSYFEWSVGGNCAIGQDNAVPTGPAVPGKTVYRKKTV